MIKKILLVFSVVCLATVTAINTQFTLKSNLPFLLDQIEALASGESGASNTGPREEKKCYGGGHKMVCRSINSESCTDSDCY